MEIHPDIKEAVQLINGSGLSAKEKEEAIAVLVANYAVEEAKVKRQSAASVKEAGRILATQLEQLEAKRDPMVPVVSVDGSRLYGTKDAAILFKADGTVSLMLVSRSLEAIWRSVAGRLGALAIDPNDPNEQEIARLKNDRSLSKEERAKRTDLLRKVKQPQQRAGLDPVVFELAMMAFETSAKRNAKQPKRIELDLSTSVVRSKATIETLGHMLCDSYSPDINLSLPDTTIALHEMLCETEEHSFERRRDQFIQQINAAWAIRHRVDSIYYRFLDELQKLARKHGRPPSKGELAEQLESDAQRISRLCRELCFDWLPTGKPGRKHSRPRRLNSLR
jgi:hypothetical protein